MEISFLPEGMIAQMISVIAGENDRGGFTQPKPIDLVKNAPHLLIHERDGRVVGRPHAFLIVGIPTDLILGRTASSQAHGRNVIEVAVELRRQDDVLPTIRFEILSRRNHRIVRSHKSRRDEERFLVMLPQQLDRLGRGLVIGLVGSVAVVLHGDEHAMRHGG